MPVYEFRMPAAAAGLTVRVYADGVEVESVTAPAADGVQGPCVVSLTLDAGVYEARAWDGSNDTGIRAPGVLSVEDSFTALNTTFASVADLDAAVLSVVQAVDLTGATIPGYRARIIFDAAGEPDDITLEAI